MKQSDLSKKLAAIMGRQIKKIVPKITLRVAKKLRERAKIVARIWRNDVFNWMDASPAPGMPKRRTGQLAKALHYKTERLTRSPNGGYILTVRHWWDRTVSRTSGEDYGSIINHKTKVKGYRDRINFELKHVITKVLEGR